LQALQELFILSKMMLIINADDFGLDTRTNQGILQSFKKGLCSSTTLMSNMPGFKEASQLSHEHNLLDHIGMHLVLRDGYPLTEKIRDFPKFCNRQGQLSFSPDAFFLSLGGSEKRALAGEIRAQIRHCREYGIPLTHLDAHHNLHNIWAVASVLIPILRQEKIAYLRIKKNSDFYLLPLRIKIYTQIFNYRLKVMKLNRTRYFGSVENYLCLKNGLSSFQAIDSFEISVHPRLSEKGELVSAVFDKEIDLETQIRQIDTYRESVSFSGKRYL